MKRQQGFTLVEIAIVLVIIGLLLGGILKGQEMITQAKIKNAIADFSGISAAYHGYVDRYKKIPGDDPCAGTGAGLTTGNCGTTTARLLAAIASSRRNSRPLPTITASRLNSLAIVSPRSASSSSALSNHSAGGTIAE